jgi:hypothetical protein
VRVSAVEPTGGFIDGDTAVTLRGSGFFGYSGHANTTLVGFGGAAQEASELNASSLTVLSPPFGGFNGSLGVAALNESVALSLALNLFDFEPAAGEDGASALRYTYYYHTTSVLEPSGGPSVGGTHVAVLGSGFESFDGGAGWP